jgi:hypothetical protein
MALLKKKKDSETWFSIETHFLLHAAFFGLRWSNAHCCSATPTEIKCGVHSSVGNTRPLQLGCGIAMNTTWYQQDGARPHTSNVFGLLQLHGASYGRIKLLSHCTKQRVQEAHRAN